MWLPAHRPRRETVMCLRRIARMRNDAGDRWRELGGLAARGRLELADQSVPKAERDSLRAVADAELAEQPAGVRLDGVLG